MGTEFWDLFHFRKKRYAVGSEDTAHEITCVESNSDKDGQTYEEFCLSPDFKEPYLKCRYVVAFLGFWIFVLLNSLGLHMSVTLVAMVNNTAIISTTQKSDSCPSLISNASNDDYLSENYEKVEGEFTWSPKIQGYILGSFFVGLIVFHIPAGLLCERFGCKGLLLLSGCVISLATLLIPVVSRQNVYCLIALQALRGLIQAIFNPAVSVLAANWFPKTERGFLNSLMLSGFSAGSITGSVLSGYTCEYLGWPYSFYIMGTAGVILSLFIAVFLYESPKEHPRISQAELEYILYNQENVLSRRRQSPPWRKIFSSIPVYALIIAMFGRNWSLFYFLTVHSTYLGTILHYSIKENGFFSAAPFFLEFVFSHIASWLSSYMQKTNCMSIDHIRKFWNFLACLGFGVSLLCISLAGCNSSLSALFGILCVGFKGLSVCGCRIVPNDMSPTFAGTLISTAVTFSSFSGLIIPLLIGYLTNEQQTIEQWNKLIFISAGFVISTGIIFACFGSAEVQSWNFTTEENTSHKDKEDHETQF